MRPSIFPYLLLSLMVILLLGNSAPAADRMTYEQYLQAVQGYQAEEATYLEQTAKVKAQVEAIKTQIAELRRQLATLWDEVYTTANTTPEKVDAASEYIAELERELANLSRLTPEQLFERMAEIDTLKAKVDGLLDDPERLLSENWDRVQKLAIQVDQLRQRAQPPKPSGDIYDVVRGDCLWNISKKQQIFGDPLKWPRIWSANRTEINDPDLIFPQQRLRIPRNIGQGQYVVMQGDFLRKIAEQIYGDPFQWRKLHQANKAGRHLQDPNLIYPEQILDVPRN